MSDAFPEPSLLIRQGSNVQGPYLLSRIRRYVAQRRIQPYMLFSQDGIFWVAPEHVPGLIPEDYAPLPPPSEPTAVDAAAPPLPAAPGQDFGSDTLVGYQIDEDELDAEPAVQSPVPPPPPPSIPRVPALTETEVRPTGPTQYHVRSETGEVYGPCTEEVIQTWIAEGRVDATTDFSVDGGPWTLGGRLPDLFPVARTPRRQRRRR